MNKFLIFLNISLLLFSCSDSKKKSNSDDNDTKETTISKVNSTNYSDPNDSLVSLNIKLNELRNNLDTAILFESLNSSGNLIFCTERDSDLVEQGFYSVFLKTNGSWTIQKFSQCNSSFQYNLNNFIVNPSAYENYQIYLSTDTVNNIPPNINDLGGFNFYYKFYNVHFITGQKYYYKEGINEDSMDKICNPKWHKKNSDNPLWKLIQKLEQLSNNKIFE